jgi:hypothetical protein
VLHFLLHALEILPGVMMIVSGIIGIVIVALLIFIGIALRATLRAPDEARRDLWYRILCNLFDLLSVIVCKLLDLFRRGARR